MNTIVKFFHHLFNPHCEECFHEKQESKICQSCETLKQMLESANFEKKQLLDSLLETTRPIVEPVYNQERQEPIRPKITPWHIRRQQLEEQDREAARLMKQKQEEINASQRSSSGGLNYQEIKKQTVEDLEQQLEIGENNA